MLLKGFMGGSCPRDHCVVVITKEERAFRRHAKFFSNHVEELRAEQVVRNQEFSLRQDWSIGSFPLNDDGDSVPVLCGDALAFIPSFSE